MCCSARLLDSVCQKPWVDDCLILTDIPCSALEKEEVLRETWAAQKTIIVASCAGQLPAAIAACTRSLDELVDLAPETVAIAFRIGMDVDRRTASLGNDRSQSWAKAVFGVTASDAQRAVDKFLLSEVSRFKAYRASLVYSKWLN